MLSEAFIPLQGFFSAEIPVTEEISHSCRPCLHRVYCQTPDACSTPLSAAA